MCWLVYVMVKVLQLCSQTLLHLFYLLQGMCVRAYDREILCLYQCMPRCVWNDHQVVSAVCVSKLRPPQLSWLMSVSVWMDDTTGSLSIYLTNRLLVENTHPPVCLTSRGNQGHEPLDWALGGMTFDLVGVSSQLGVDMHILFLSLSCHLSLSLPGLALPSVTQILRKMWMTVARNTN